MKSGTIIEKTIFPSPNPAVELYSITYWADGLRVKGLLAEPKGDRAYPAFFILEAG